MNFSKEKPFPALKDDGTVVLMPSSARNIGSGKCVTAHCTEVDQAIINALQTQWKGAWHVEADQFLELSLMMC
jgi:hypothetical protein